MAPQVVEKVPFPELGYIRWKSTERPSKSSLALSQTSLAQRQSFTTLVSNQVDSDRARVYPDATKGLRVVPRGCNLFIGQASGSIFPSSEIPPVPQFIILAYAQTETQPSL